LIWPFMFTEDSYEHIEICVLNCFGCVIKNWNLIVAYSAKGAMNGLVTSMHIRVLPCELWADRKFRCSISKVFFPDSFKYFPPKYIKMRKKWTIAVNGKRRRIIICWENFFRRIRISSSLVFLHLMVWSSMCSSRHT